jgi:AcrR family transcriptional regulator
MRQRGDAWELRAYVGKDPVTGREKYKTLTLRGGNRAAAAELARFVTQVSGGGHGAGDTTLAELIRSWIELVRDDLSQSTVRGYERIIRCYIDPSVGRNRAKILQVARTAFAQSDADVSMAEISRRAGVGMATLYRNFPDRRELLEALYTDEVDAVCEAANTSGGERPGAAFIAWIRRFFAFSTSKRLIASELLVHADSTNPVFGESRARVLEAGRPLLVTAQRAHEIRSDLTLEQALPRRHDVRRLWQPRSR